MTGCAAGKPTIILSQRFSSDSQDIWRAAVRAGWGVHRAIRFSVPDPLPEQVCVYGELPTCDIIAERAGLALLDPPDRWLAFLPREFTKRWIYGCGAADLAGFSERAFFKPANDKVFEKGIFERGSDVPTRYISPECPCLISEVVAFDREVRLWCLDGKIVAQDFYQIIGDHDPETVNQEAREFGQCVLDECAHELPSGVVLDVGYIEGRGWAVVEANQAYASGIYGNTDLNGVLAVVLRSSGRSGGLLERDRQFIRES